MKKKIVIALGGNALGDNLKEQEDAARVTSKAIVDLIEQGHQVVIVHGNGPQVGMINLAFETASKHQPKLEFLPLYTCGAMSQAYIGFDLQKALRDELISRKLSNPVATVITQVLVNENDEAFHNPTKPIGSFYSEEESRDMEKLGMAMMEDAGRGYRRVVPSPQPVDIIEKEIIKSMMNSAQVCIAVGGGGIPVVSDGNRLSAVNAVIDKDFAGAKLAEIIEADMLIILTAVEKVAINFGKPDQKWLDNISLADAQSLIAEGHFAKGSMLPKVEAAVKFASSKKGRKALITLLEKAKDGIEGKTGTVIENL